MHDYYSTPKAHNDAPAVVIVVTRLPVHCAMTFLAKTVVME